MRSNNAQIRNNEEQYCPDRGMGKSNIAWVKE
jgi:hypothetical protein